MLKGSIIGLSLLFIILIIPCVTAQEDTFFITNSGDWREVYLGEVYADIMGYDSKFLMSERHSDWIPNFIDLKQKIFVIESETVPFTIDYKKLLESQGYEVDEYISEDTTETNLYLARKLVAEKGIKNFILLDDSYGYNALSIASYAVLKDSYILFVTAENLEDIQKFLKEVGPKSLLMYGSYDDEVTEALKGSVTEVINKGNRFSNNLEIAKRYITATGCKQALLTNGRFIESELVSGGNGKEAVIFIGQDDTPEQVIAFLKSSKLTTGVLIGNEYVTSAKSLKERTGLNIFVKFAQTSATPSELQKVEGLDRFMLPSFDFNVTIDRINYNTHTKQLEVVFRNLKNMKTFVKTDIGISLDGTRIHALGDKEAFQLNRMENKGVGYDVDLTENIRNNEELEASLYARFGESPFSLERAIEVKFPISVVSESDNCDMRINKVSYDKGIQRFLVEVENIGNDSCYARPTLRNIIISDKPIDLESEEVEKVGKGDTLTFKIKQRMDSVDLADNEVVTANIVYGSREEFLLNIFEDEFGLLLEEGNALGKITGAFFEVTFIKNNWKYGIIILVMIAFLFIGYRLGKRGKNNE